MKLFNITYHSLSAKLLSIAVMVCCALNTSAQINSNIQSPSQRAGNRTIQSPSQRGITRAQSTEEKKRKSRTLRYNTRTTQAQRPMTATQKYQRGMTLFKQNKVNEAFKLFEEAANENVVEAQLQMGRCYESGTGTGEGIDMFKAMEYYTQAMENGNNVALEQVNRLEADAVKLFNKGVDYYNKENYKRAFTYFKEASELGFAAAQNMLGYCYMSGLGTEQSLAEGIMWYELAVGQQDDDAEFNLATCYLEGKGTQVNKEKAIELLTRSAERDNVKAISTLGICYETGDGVQPDRNKAISLYRRAADQGDEYAIQALQQLDDQEIPATDDNGNIEF